MPERDDIPKAYDPSAVEDGLYARWERSGLFDPDRLPDAERRTPFTIVMPPPNATGTLHVGHAVMLALEDLMIRYKRMRGFASLWLPGTDHAAIATNAKVEKLLQEQEGKTRFDVGREAFIERAEAFVEGSRGTIRNQVRKMGSSCDWSRERFTFDEERSHAVRVMFKKMFDDGLIYRGDRIVNWCPRCGSTLADDEVEHKERQAKLYTLKYGPFLVATTRPETKLGDTAVAVHPDDERYKDRIGETFTVNWGEGTAPLEIRVIGDREVDPEFGTGVLGVTPSHSATDFRMAEEHGLPRIKVIGEDGRMTEAAGKYAGMAVEEARAAFVADLERSGLVERVDDVQNQLSVCYRCGSAIEPLTSLQWFVDVNKEIPGRGKSLKQLATEAVGDGKIAIVPERFKKVYFHWMDNLRDWCVSRQVWYGHRVPVWYTKDGDPIVSVEEPENAAELTMDTDTLDTWFSSSMWTFSTLGWPKETEDLKRFHPTQVLETGYDILFFWVARMILMTTYAMQETPFETVYLHGLVRDEQGRKMSKSLGNIIDPLDVAKKYGTDAVRLSLVIGTAPGADTKIWEDKIAGFRNFTNKLWNVSRFVLTSVGEVRRVAHRPGPVTLADRWILTRLQETAQEVSAKLEAYDFSPAGEALRDFTWNEFADWYLETAKVQLEDDASRERTEEILLYALETLLKLWHPFMPFVTESVWDKLAGNEGGDAFLMVESWPMLKPMADGDEEAKEDHATLREVVRAVRDLRGEHKVEPKKKVSAVLAAGAKAKMLEGNAEVIKRLARLERLEIVGEASELGARRSEVAAAMAGSVEVLLPLEGFIDPGKERERLEKERADLERYVAGQEKRLGNEAFAKNAPEKVVEDARRRLEEAKDQLRKIAARLSSL